MKKVGILGGSFSPVHLGHLCMAQTACEKLNLDEVLFIPTCKTPNKKQANTATCAQRLRMTQLAMNGTRNFHVSDIEIKRKGISYSIDTVRTLKEKYPKGTKFYFIIGEDNYQTLHTWKNINTLSKEVRFVVVNRGLKKNKAKKFKACFIEMPRLDISSTLIRKSVAQEKSTQYYVPKKVEQYIKRNRLYK